MILFKTRKIKKLLEQCKVSENKPDAQLITELKQFGNPAVHCIIEYFQQKKLSSQHAEVLLNKTCDDSCVKFITPLLGDPYDEVRRVAKQMIIKRWPQSSTELLIANLQSPDMYMRNNSAELLSKFKNRSCESALISMFNKAGTELKRNIINILGELAGSTARKLIISALNDSDWRVRQAAVQALRKLKSPECVEPLIKKLDENDPQIKMPAIDALGYIGDKRAIKPLIELLKDPDLLVRQKASDSLIDIADSDVVPDVINLLKNDDVNVRRSAVEVLRNMKAPNTTEALMKAIKDSDWWVRQIATDFLSALKGGNIVNGFIGLTDDEDEGIRRCAVEFFIKVPRPEAFDALVKRLNDNDWWVRERTVAALGKLRDKRAVVHLAKLKADREVSGSVPHALAEIEGDEALHILREFVADSGKQARIEAMRALAKLDCRDAVGDLKQCLSDPDKAIGSEAVLALKELTGEVFEIGEQAVAFSFHGGPIQAGDSVTEAIVVIDLCNSTDLTSRYGDSYALRIMHKLSGIVKPAAKREECRFLKGTGDGYLLTFPKAENAVRFSFMVLNSVLAYNAKAGKDKKIELRFALNFGEAKIDETGDRLGANISMTFRVEGVKPEALIPVEDGMKQHEMPLSNRILITENFAKEIEELTEVEIRLMGLFELKGITGLHRIYQLRNESGRL